MTGVSGIKCWGSASRVGLITGLCLLFLKMAAPPDIFAGLLSLEPASPRTVGPQDTSVPCIIAGTICQNPDGFDWTDFEQKGNISEYDVLSPEYDFEDLPSQFNIAIRMARYLIFSRLFLLMDQRQLNCTLTMTTAISATSPVTGMDLPIGSWE